MNDQPPTHYMVSRRHQVLADIADVAEQFESGELNRETADQLTLRYEKELVTIEAEAASEPRSALGGRRSVGTLILVAFFIAVAAFAYDAARPREGGFITGDVGNGVDLDTVSDEAMEAVIAANPDIPQVAAMRIALADRYFDDFAYSDALPHYLAALRGQLDSSRRARALARIGWMTFVVGRADLAEEYLVRAVATEPDYEEAHFFLGLVYLDGRDADRALAELKPLRDSDEMPDDLREQLETAIAAAEALAGEGGNE